MKRGIFRGFEVGVIALVLGFTCSSIALAEDSTSNCGEYELSIDNTVYLISPNTAKSESYWEQKDGSWVYHDCTGEIVTGYFFDDKGDIYYADEAGYIKLGQTDEMGQEYGLDGRLINPGYTDTYDFNTLCIRLEAGENIEFWELNDLYNFLEYYGKEYNINSQALTFSTYKKRKCSEDKNLYHITYFTNNVKNVQYDRVRLLGLLEEVFPERLEGNSLLEKLYDACNKLGRIKYSDELIGSTMENALQHEQGGCWHFAKLVHWLLEREGINAEIVTGMSYGVPHMWIRLRDENGAWIYCDPTYYSNGLEEYLNIDYKVYLNNYRVNRFFNSKEI